MWTLIALLILGDLVLAVVWLHERKAHRMSRNALTLSMDSVRHWRGKYTELDAAGRISDVHTPGVRRVRVSPARGKAGEHYERT